MTVVTNPYVGLRPFESNESLYFFGRQEQIVELLERLHRHQFVAVVGSSGSGKSSLIKAGLVPRLKAGHLVEDRHHWITQVMKPGQNPLYNLTKAIEESITSFNGKASAEKIKKEITETGEDAILSHLRPLLEAGDTNYFLLVDQFEELFRFATERVGREKNGTETVVEKNNEAIDFVNLLLALSHQKDWPIYVVITMRSDYIGDCVQFYGLPEVLNQSQYLVPRLNRSQRKRAIEGPAKLVGEIINPSLTAKLLNDVESEKDELPLLQHALMRIWDYEKSIDQNGQLDLHDYEEVGGLKNALSNHADEVIIGMAEEDLKLIKKIFQALTMTDENGREIRRPVKLSELMSTTGSGGEKILEMVDLFIQENRSFLVKSEIENSEDDLLIDISHESLIRQWTTLKKWVDEEHRSAETYLNLVKAARLHQEKKRGVLSELEIQEVTRWLEYSKPHQEWANRYDRDYYGLALQCFDKSKEWWKEEQEKLRRAEQDRIENARRKRRIRIISWFAGITGALAVVLVFLVVFARTQSAEAEKQRDYAQYAREDALAQRDGAEMARLQADSATMVAREQEAFAGQQRDRADLSRAEAEIQRNVADFARTEAERQQVIAEQQRQQAEAQKRLAVKAEQRADARRMEALILRNLSTSRAMAVKSEEVQDDALQVLLAKQAYYSHTNNSGDILDPDIYDALYYSLKTLKGHAFNILKGHQDAIRSILFTGDNALYTASSDRHILRFELEETVGDMNTQDLHSVEGIYSSMDIHPNGQGLICGTSNGSIFVYDKPQAERKTFNNGHKGAVISVKSINDNRVVSLGIDNRILIWDLNQGPEEMPMVLSDGSLINLPSSSIYLEEYEKFNNLGISPGKKYLAICSSKGNIFLADLREMLFIKKLAIPDSPLWSVAFSPDGKWLVAGDVNGLVNRWIIEEIENPILQMPPLIGHSTRVNEIRFSPDGKLLATASFDRTVRVWNWSNLRNLPIILKDHDTWVITLAFSNDSQKIVTGCRDGALKVWDMRAATMFQKMKDEPIAQGLLTDDQWKTYVGDIELYDDTFKLLYKP